METVASLNESDLPIIVPLVQQLLAKGETVRFFLPGTGPHAPADGVLKSIALLNDMELNAINVTLRAQGLHPKTGPIIQLEVDAIDELRPHIIYRSPADMEAAVLTQIDVGWELRALRATS